ncbi:uncharacterized protein AKAME5_002950300 [Lates japonicus]|uniref:Ig-like domain-containing protein n=1 Tax=Lates japonicus TaxID=270547 RepID=A0AAD3M2X9_LATJO|nr:uncharacterized protein AKAME5_002950300 [Lates japonicus]
MSSDPSVPLSPRSSDLSVPLVPSVPTSVCPLISQCPGSSLSRGGSKLLSGLTVSAVSLNVSPNRLQFFIGESISLRCEGQVVSDGQTVKRTRGGQTEDCGPAGSSCIISDLSSSDSGVYWCEDRAGQRRDEVNITVISRLSDKAGLLVKLCLCLCGSGLLVKLCLCLCGSGSDVKPETKTTDPRLFQGWCPRDLDLSGEPLKSPTEQYVTERH